MPGVAAQPDAWAHRRVEAGFLAEFASARFLVGFAAFETTARREPEWPSSVIGGLSGREEKYLVERVDQQDSRRGANDRVFTRRHSRRTISLRPDSIPALLDRL
jgi:hypothetical protein